LKNFINSFFQAYAGWIIFFGLTILS
jgi:hypothetical protein